MPTPPPTLAEWSERIAKTLEVETVEDLYAHCKPYRKIRVCFIVPVGCCPCMCWSCVWRLLCCPVQVFRHGCDSEGDACCRNNCCTDATDNCVEEFVRDTPRKLQLPHLDDVLKARTETEQDRALIRATLGLVEARFANPDGKREYTELDFGICEVVVRSIDGCPDAAVPAFVGLRLWKVRQLRGL
jgi:hypothetical protein